MVSAMRCGGNCEGEASASTSAAAGDSYHKRVKVYSGLNESIPWPSTGRDYNINQRSSNSSNNGIFDHNFILDYGSDENPFGVTGNCEIDEDPLTEDFKIQMDLTDDLLHMVFSFLDHGNLCHAAMVCRQWQAASTHEDFWRCLNFENRNLSIEQFDDMCHRYPNATEVNLSGTRNMHMLSVRLPMLTVLKLENCEGITSASMAAIAHSFMLELKAFERVINPVKWYKGGPALPRKMILQGVLHRKFDVEVYPLCLKLTDSRDDSQLTIWLSRKCPAMFSAHAPCC
ncbi:hypothetical protein V6N13_123220 [Hibiscus sabdariffa]